MNKKILITIVVSISLTISFACTQGNSESKKVIETKEEVSANVPEPSNGIFEVISFDNDSVKFKAVVETKFYALSLISGDQTFEGKRWSNAEGTVKWANGAQFWAGSSMSMPANFGIDAMTLPQGIVMTISFFDVPDDFEAEKIRFMVEEGALEMYYNTVKSSWDK